MLGDVNITEYRGALTLTLASSALDGSPAHRAVSRSQGETFDQALANLREALQLYFEDEPFPEGIEPPIIATVNVVDTGVENAAPDTRTSPQCL